MYANKLKKGKKGKKGKRRNEIRLGDLRIQKLSYIPPHEIITKEDLEKLNRKIEYRINCYSLDSLLLMIHDSYLAKQFPPFIAGMMTKYALLNSDLGHGYSIYDENDLATYEEEFYKLLEMICGYSVYDPFLDQESEIMNDQNKWASFILRKIGSQVRWNIPLHNMLGRTIFLYDELAKSDQAPNFIKNLVSKEFEDKFGFPLLDFIKMGFLIFAGSNKPKGLTRKYFEVARTHGVPIVSDEIISKCLEHVTCSPKKFKQLCLENDYGEEFLRAYKFNPLFSYPLIRPWDRQTKELEEDRFIAPIPELVLYRFTTGLYYQFVNNFGLEFNTSFGRLFEQYFGEILKWFNLPGIILSENDIENLLPKYTGKKPDWTILCEYGTIFFECKATKYSQDIYEHGIDAKNDSIGCIRHINTAVLQFDEFEEKIPILNKKFGFNYSKKDLLKYIVTFEPLLGLKEGPVRHWFEKGKSKEDSKMDWHVIWIGELEAIQPYITRGASLWNFLKRYWEEDINSLIDEMRSETGSSYVEGILYQYEEKIFDELLKNQPK